MSASALKRLKNHNILHLHPYSTMFMPIDRLQLKIYAFSRQFNVCSVLITGGGQSGTLMFFRNLNERC